MLTVSVLTPFRRLVLVATDVAIFVGSIFLALSVREVMVVDVHIFLQHVLAFLPVLCFAIIAFFVGNLYEDDLFILRQKILYRILAAYVFIALGAVSLFYTYPYQSVTPKSILVLFLVFSFLGAVTVRYILPRLFGKTKAKEGIVIATGPESQHVYTYVNSYSHIPLSFHDLVPLETAASFLRAHQSWIGCIVVNTKKSLGEEIQRLLFDRVRQGSLIVDEAFLYEAVFKKVELSDANYRAFFEPVSASKKLFLFWKRCTDVTVALMLALPSLILVACAACAIRLETKGPIFIAQVRLGKFGKRIRLWKLRTMTHSDTGKWLREDNNENKVTRVGYFLRKTRIDELPQLINILRGDLSLIGPRPDMEGFVGRLQGEIPYYDLRHVVTPGLSGWAQIHQEKPPQSVEETRERLAYDLYYVKYRSIVLDLYIALKTIKTLLSRTGM